MDGRTDRQTGRRILSPIDTDQAYMLVGLEAACYCQLQTVTNTNIPYSYPLSMSAGYEKKIKMKLKAKAKAQAKVKSLKACLNLASP